MPEYRLISWHRGGEPAETIDLLANDLEAVLAFVRRQRALIEPQVELWHDGKLLLSLPPPGERALAREKAPARNARDS